MLSLVHVPTLVLHNFYSVLGDHRANAARYLAEHIDGARLVEVRGKDALFFGGDYDPVIDTVAEFVTGQRPPFEVDRILTTVLFTDIVGSTRAGGEGIADGASSWRASTARHGASSRAFAAARSTPRRRPAREL